MVAAAVDLWSLALGASHVDADALAAAIEREAAQGTLDFRTRLLIRDSLAALAAHWGNPRFEQWISKLFSNREKDRDDLRVLQPRLDKTTLTRRLLATTASHRADPALLSAAQRNWYVLFGDPLPA